MSLTVRRTARLLKQGVSGRYLDSGSAGVRGLYLVIDSPAAASWQLRYQLAGRTHWLGLGSARTFSLDKARARAREHREKLADKIDPLAVRRAERAAQAAAAIKAMSFEAAAQAYYEQHEGGWTNRRHAAQFLSSLRQYAFPIIGKLPVAAIDTPLVLAVLEQKVEAAKGYPAGSFWLTRTTTADRTRNRIQLVLDWASVRGYRPPDPNPARWRGHLSNTLAAPSKIAKVEHHRAVPFVEVPDVMASLAAQQGIGAQAVRLAILTATRSNEVISACWNEINFKEAVWTIPAERMKGRKEHRVPLSVQAIELLKQLYTEDGNPHLFIGERGVRLSTMGMGDALRRAGRSETVHGFRSSFSDWAHERTAHANHAIEISLAHAVGSDVEQAYRRGDLFEKRRKLMADWARYCSTPIPKSDDVVMSIRGRR
jgi:integrase